MQGFRCYPEDDGSGWTVEFLPTGRIIGRGLTEPRAKAVVDLGNGAYGGGHELGRTLGVLGCGFWIPAVVAMGAFVYIAARLAF